MKEKNKRIWNKKYLENKVTELDTLRGIIEQEGMIEQEVDSVHDVDEAFFLIQNVCSELMEKLKKEKRVK